MNILIRFIFVFFFSLTLSLNGWAQSTEFSAGAGFSSFLGKESEFWTPTVGYQFAVQLFDDLPYTMDSQSYGVSLGFFPFQNDPLFQNSDMDTGFYRSLYVETAFTYRYDRYIMDFLAAYAGTDLGFQFVNLKNQQELLLTSIQSRFMIAPKIGANVEFNEYIALYLEGRYNLSLGFSSPDMEIPYSNWQHLWNLSTGLRFRF